MSINDLVLAQYEKNTTPQGNTNKVSNEDRLKKYFTTVLPNGTQKAEKRIRILPTSDGTTPFKEVMFHEVKLGDKWVKIYDPAQEGERSPLNETYEGLRMSGNEADRELAKQYRSRKYYIVKIIDRDNESDGVKFWRFKDNYKGDGIFDKIVPLFKSKGDITNVEEGRDITLSLSLTTSNTGGKYTSVTTIIPDDKSPLSNDKAQAEEWLNDDLTWNDVYSKKSEDYLILVANGKIPKWDSNLKKWSTEEEMKSETETTIGGDTNDTSAPLTNMVDPQVDDAEDDDLPF